MPKIHVLPVHLVNKIAAGEVIERPASIVKELVENALDAGATRVGVSIEDGGRRLISVSDDGCGMGADDLALAFVPHATSKLTGEEDLFRIGTMGFRGEALASIASISHASIRTARRDDPAGGWEIEASGETAGEVRPCAAAPGTTVTIRDVFFNTPARRKFMKAASTEMGHITEQIIRLALPQPHVAFTVTHNGRTVQNLPTVGSTLLRAADVFGRDLGGGLMEIAPRGPRAVRVGGLIGSPASARASGKWQYIFLNGRYIRDRLLSHAIREAYRGRLDPSRWPVALVFLEIDPGEVDVNVHPTKVEVRFRDSQVVHGELLAAMRETLNRANLSPDISLATNATAGDPLGPPDEPTDLDRALGMPPFGAAPAEGGPLAPPADAPADDERKASLRQAMADFFHSAPPTQPRFTFTERVEPRLAPVSLDDGRPAPPACAPLGPSATAPRGAPAARCPAVQLHNAYIVTHAEDGIVIIDQHALHERLLYNDLRDRFAAGGLTGQRMLIPQTLTVTPQEAAAAGHHENLLARLGIELAAFGPMALAIQQFPTMLAQRGAEPTEFVREVLDRLAEDASAGQEAMLERLLQTLACKAAIKAGDPLTPAEIDALLARRDQCGDKAAACPHGRPTQLKVSLKDLQKQFKRT